MFDGLAEALFVIIIITIIATVISLAVKISSRWILFCKCKEEGWKSLIPVYTDLTVLKVSGLSWWWIFLIYGYSFLYGFYVVFMILNATQGSYEYETITNFLNLIQGFASLVYLFARFNIGINLAKKFNQSAGYGVLIMFFEPIMFYILGLSKSYEYDENIEVSKNGIFGFTKENEVNVFCPECGAQGKASDIYCNNCGKKMR